MPTRFNALLAPIGESTGDGRRFALGALEADSLPLPVEWQRTNDMGHDGSVQVGRITDVTVDEDAGQIRGEGELFTDVDPDEMPRLAEDVAEARHLIEQGTLGFSVDLDDFDAVPARPGSNEEVTEEEVEDMLDAGEDDIEMLVTRGRIRAATLVSIPAFAETGGTVELVESEDEPDEDQAAVVASVAPPATSTVDPGLFTAPELDGLSPVEIDWTNRTLAGYVAPWGTCHTGMKGVCVTAPPAPEGDYSWFHRELVDTEDGAVAVGRLTIGGTHADTSKSLSAAIGHYDGLKTGAYVRVGEDEHGIWMAGVLADDLTEQDERVLSRQKVSGDWRPTQDGFALVDVMALPSGDRSIAEPGYPITASYRNGRQTALVASFGVPTRARRGAPARAAELTDAQLKRMGELIEEGRRMNADRKREQDEAAQKLRSTVDTVERARLRRAMGA